MGVKEEPAEPWNRPLMERIGNEAVLLVLDNCEHLLDACARLVDLMLRRCENLRILANGREAWGSPASMCSGVVALSSRSEAGADTGKHVRSAAVQLFNDRALLVRADFRSLPTTPRR
jgi:predicted ATPase